MGMSSRVTGFAPPDVEWKKMKAVWDACKTANVPAPKEVSEYFDWRTPDETGVEVRIPDSMVREFSPFDGADGWEVDLSKLPKNVKFLRFVNSY